MEKKRIKLADGRIVLRGPWIDRSGIWALKDAGFRVGIYAISPATLQYGEKFGESITILEVHIPAYYFCDIYLPRIEILQKELWTKDLMDEVIRELRQSDIGLRGQRAIGYVIAKLSRAFEKEKELVLENGRLIGDLEFSTGRGKEIGHYDLNVLGDIKDPKTGKVQKTTLLTIQNLYPNFWPGPAKRPDYVKNKEFWCKKLEYLVTNYLNLLADFAGRPIDEQISKIVRDLASRSEWSVKCHNIFQKLLSISPDLREDEKISKALELIEEVSQ